MRHLPACPPDYPQGFRRAFTLVEILLVLTLITLSALPFVISTISFQSRQTLLSNTQKVVFLLRQAHVSSRESQGFKTWGVQATTLTSYQLVSATVGNSPVVEQTYTLDPKLQFESLFTIWFTPVTGELDSTLSTIPPFYLRHDLGKRSQINILSTGVVESKLL